MAANLRGLAAAPWFDETLPTIHAGYVADGARITVPMTIGWGVLPPRQARRAAALLPQARRVTLPGCRHIPTYDDPQAVARLLLEASAPTG